MFNRFFSHYSSVLFLWCLTLFAVAFLNVKADGQVSADEAYKRLQERAATRRAAPTQAAPSASTRPSSKVGPLAVPPARPVGSRDTEGAADSDSALLKARSSFKTVIRPGAVNPQDDHGEKPDLPPGDVARLIHYHSPLGMMNAYITPDPRDGKKHPAVLWIHGGFGGLSSFLFSPNQPASNDQTVTAFLAAKIVIMCPGFRGQNDDPGKFEMFYGEVDDAVAALDALRRLPYVDPSRIYLAGHSTGGTMALLTAEASNKIRAAFSLAGCPDVTQLIDEPNHHNAPFDFLNPQEAQLRSAVNFVSTLKTPLWLFDQSESMYVPQARRMRENAEKAKAPFRVFTIAPATHFDIVRPLTQLIVAKILADMGPACNIDFKPEEIARAFGKVFDGRTEDVQEILPASAAPAIRISDQAKLRFQRSCQKGGIDPSNAYLKIEPDGDHYKATITRGWNKYATVNVDGIAVAMSDRVMSQIGPFLVEIDSQAGNINLKVVQGADAKLDEPQLRSVH